MARLVTTFAVRYQAVDGKAQVYPEQGLNREDTQVAIGRIIDAAHAQKKVLAFIAVVPCVKRPGSRVIAEISRRTMTQEQLVHVCNFYHGKAVEASC